MGKREKAQPAGDGRVPLVGGGTPLLYPRYKSVEELLQLGKAKSDREVAVAGERPSKKQKRDIATAGTALNGSAVGPLEVAAVIPAAGPAPSSKYVVIGEDGLNYKQRRQLQRAEERAARAQAEAAAVVVAGDKGGEPGAEALAVTAPVAPKEATAKDDKKGRKKMMGRQGIPEPTPTISAAVETAGAAATGKGDANEAAKMRAVLGFTASAGGSGGGAVAVDDGKFLLSALVGAERHDKSGDGDGDVGERPGLVDEAVGEDGKKMKKEEKKKRKEEKKRKKEEKKAKRAKQRQESSKKRKEEDSSEGEEEDFKEQQQGTAAVPAATTTVVKPAATAVVSGGTQPRKDNRPHAPSDGKVNGLAPGGQKHFTFNFELQAEVEAEAETKLKRFMAMDSVKDGFVPRRVWVSGIPHEYDEETIREYWGFCGELEDLFLMTFPDSGNFNGTAFITFKTQEGFESALACHGEMLEGRALKVEKCKAMAELKGKERATAAHGATGRGVAAGRVAERVPQYPVAYVGNISFEVKAEDLERLFTEAGVVPTVVRLHTDKASGRSKGYAHVHFASEADVTRAIELDGTAFRGRKIRVSYAQSKAAQA